MIFLIVYSRIRHAHLVGWRPRKLRFLTAPAVLLTFWRILSPLLEKIKTTTKVVV